MALEERESLVWNGTRVSTVVDDLVPANGIAKNNHLSILYLGLMAHILVT